MGAGALGLAETTHLNRVKPRVDLNLVCSDSLNICFEEYNMGHLLEHWPR